MQIRKGTFRFGNSAATDLITIADIATNATSLTIRLWPKPMYPPADLWLERFTRLTRKEFGHILRRFIFG